MFCPPTSARFARHRAKYGFSAPERARPNHAPGRRQCAIAR
ncbi:DUF2760 domain-containing protein, partial [Burkholderia territorii]